MSKIDSVQLVGFVEVTSPAKLAHIVGGSAFPDLPPQSFNQVNPAHSQASFKLDDYQLTVTSSPGRYDFLLQKFVESDEPTFALIDQVVVKDKLLPNFTEFVQTVPIKRLAVVISGTEPAENSAATVTSFQKMGNDLGLPKGTTEIDVRFNVPLLSRVEPDLEVNRLHRWFSAGNTMILMAGGPSGAAVTHSLIQWNLNEVVDINTSVDVSVSGRNLPALVDELFNEAIALLGTTTSDLEGWKS